MGNMYTILQDLCAKRGITITEMCREAGVPRSSVGNLATGSTQQLSSKNIKKLASFFNVSTDYLLGNEKEPATDSDGFRLEDDIDLADVDIAFLGGFKELTEENQATIRDMVRIMRERQKE